MGRGDLSSDNEWRCQRVICHKSALLNSVARGQTRGLGFEWIGQGVGYWQEKFKGWTKCNTDASFSLTTCRSSSAAVFRDHDGKLLTGTPSTRFCSSPLAAEALVSRDAVMLANNLQIDKALFETDSLNLIQVIKLKTSIPEAVLEEIWEMEKDLPGCGFIWVPRSCNSLAIPRASTFLQLSKTLYIVKLIEHEDKEDQWVE
ncbi:hypothetical protein PIB30_021851 [Stylosanthes scabra]|uniref:RNase H type-1 domain-containing protein n=1 Tax=Stylosanthes scabra TaxID=79078 RepID=A0ABU6Z7B7_9FABA|nr:hypothetical protein [Stylosanthes scabra]